MFALYLLSEEGPNTGLSWLFWVPLIFFLMIVLIGWWVSKNKGSKSEVQHAARVDSVESTTVDDLTKLEGIGPKNSKVLNGIGILSYADLAGADAAKVQAALNAAGMQYMNPAGWIEQAKLAAMGELEALAKMQDDLKGGRKA